MKHIVPSIKLLNEGAEKPVLVAATRVTHHSLQLDT